MEDSFEDYIKICRNTNKNSEPKDNIIRKEALATIERKKECEAYAMRIVTFLLDGKLRPEIFLKSLKYLNQDYYQDVIEERALSKLCGYPICGNKVPEMPKKKFFISTKANKVYDISERKNFCSNFCYKGSVHIKSQIDSSPLWLRKYEDMPDHKLISAATVGIPGEEIHHGIDKADVDLPSFTSVAHFTQISLEDFGEMGEVSNKIKNYPKTNSALKVISEEKFDDEIDLDRKDFKSGKQQLSDDTGEKSNEKKVCVNNLDKEAKLQHLISKLKISKEPKTKLIDPPLMKQSLERKIKIGRPQDIKQDQLAKTGDINCISNHSCGNLANTSKAFKNSTEILARVNTCAREWITIETFIYIYGEEKVKNDLSQNKMEEHFDKLKIKDLDVSYQIKYMDLCRRLHMRALAEERFDNAILGNSLKPVPNFKELKDEVQELDMKVKSFYKGNLYEKLDTNFPTKSVKENVTNTEPSVVLPPIDTASQIALRRKVFLNLINKMVRTLISELDLDEDTVMPNIQELVKSFKLQSHNITFKPVMLPVVAYILIKILALKDIAIKNYLETPRSVEYCKLILLRYDGLEAIIEEIYILLKDIDKFIQNYMTD